VKKKKSTDEKAKEALLIKAKVDEAGSLHEQMKKLKDRLDTLKEDLKGYAEEHKTQVINGHKHVAIVDPYTETKVRVEDFLLFLDKVDRQELLPELIKVSVTELRKHFTAEQIKQFSVSTTDNYSRISFKALEVE
jgi:hypothetical protein